MKKIVILCTFSLIMNISQTINTGTEQSKNRPPLIAAVLNNDYPNTKALLKHNEVNAPDKKGCTPLMYASALGRENIVKLLLRYKANPNIENEYGNTALIGAIDPGVILGFSGWSNPGHPQIVEILLKNNANIQTKFGRIALFYAIGRTEPNLEIIESLLENEADPYVEEEGETPYSLAQKNNNEEVIQLIEKYTNK